MRRRGDAVMMLEMPVTSYGGGSDVRMRNDAAVTPGTLGANW